MGSMVVIDMQNKNILITVAYVSENANNPYAVFCEYIKYVLFSNSSESMTLLQIQSEVENEFGIRIPHNVLVKCLRIIEKHGNIRQKNHVIHRVGEYSTEEFENRRNEYREIEQKLIEKLVQHVAKYNKNWTIEYAREQLIKVLNTDGIAHDIFLRPKKALEDNNGISNTAENDFSETNVDGPLFADEFFVGQFINEALNEQNVYGNYLQRICEGLMLCVGAYQLPSDGEEMVFPPIKNTSFFFDTRLLLRCLGCAGKAAVTAVGELVGLIQEAGGKIYYFPQTLEEMKFALDEAIKSLSSGQLPCDEEMRLYAATVKNKSTILALKKATLGDELAKRGICLRQLTDYSSEDCIKWGFDRYDLEQYMRENLPWQSKTIENDAMSIWEVHMARRGNYSEYCGTKDRLPVFVTSNSRLISIVLNYRNNREGLKNISQWKENRLPVITDIRLTCRLWSPSVQGKKLSLLRIAANAVAAQKPTRLYLNKIRELAVQLKEQVPQYSNLYLPEFFDDRITELVLEKTNGEAEAFNVGTLASSISEIAEMSSKEKDDTILKISQERDKLSSNFDAQTKGIIDGAVESNINHLGLAGIILRLVLCWPVVATMVLTAISAIISTIVGDGRVLLVALTPVFVAVIEKVLTSKFVLKWLLDFAYPRAERYIEKLVLKRLRENELRYKEEIILRIKTENNLLEKCRQIIHQEDRPKEEIILESQNKE